MWLASLADEVAKYVESLLKLKLVIVYFGGPLL